MAIYVNGTRVTRKNFFGRDSMVSLDTTWEKLTPHRHRGDLASKVKAVLWLWRGDTVERQYKTFSELAKDLEAAASGRRENYFFEQDSEHRNVHTVIHTSSVPTTSIGMSQTEFFENLGHPDNERWKNEHFSSRALAAMMKDDFIKSEPEMLRRVVQGLKRRAEQEYLLQNMVKGAIFEAAEIANRFGMGIAVRGTGLLAHMGIESGNPTKSQEFKNKTSKEIDLWLCDELEWRDLGAVVHYDPRVEWSSQKAATQARIGKPPMFGAVATEGDWLKKWTHIDTVRRRQLATLGPRIKQSPDKEALKKLFMGRSKEYMEEDYDYRRGHYSAYTTLEGPKIRLKMRPDSDMVGDHDLFLFTQGSEYGQPAPASVVAMIQTALQSANTFQAQHGGIWYWAPTTPFNVNIKNVIMAGHSPNGPEPLVYIQPGNIVSAAYYVPEEDRIRSVWHNKSWTQWMSTTHSGGLFLNPPSD